MNESVLRLIERYDRLSNRLEGDAIARFNASIESSFRQLEEEFIRRYPAIAEQGSLLASQRRAVLINDLSELLQIIRPDQRANYEQALLRLIQESGGLGAELAEELIGAIAEDSEIRPFAGLNLEAAALQARDSAQRLYRYNDEFRGRASAIIEQGLIQGFGARRIADGLRSQLSLARFNAERIVRTEVMSALNDAAQLRYQDNGIEGVQWVATIGEVCPICVARNGRVYRTGQIRVPAHPFCRCILIPWRREWENGDLSDTEFVRDYRGDRLSDLREQGKEPDYGVSPFERMAGITRAPSPIWKP